MKSLKLKKIIYNFFKVFPIHKDKIIFMNFSGRGYGDNPKYIAEELLKNNTYNLVWCVQNLNLEIPAKIKKVKIFSLLWVYHMCTSKIWISNTRLPAYVSKRKKQIYIQTWHGGIGLKKIEGQVEEKLVKEYVIDAKKDSSNIDVILSNCKYRTNIFKKFFWYNGEVFETGCPRNDIFFDLESAKNIKEKIYKKYNLDSSQKIILFAPTFRKDKNYNYYSFDYINLIQKLNSTYYSEYVMFSRLHPNAINNVKKVDNMIDVTDYEDIYELLLIADILISDYSSIIFDFIYRKKPIYLYAPDYNSYIDERGLNFEYKELPFCISYNSDELINNILNNNYLKYEKKIDEFMKKMNVFDDGNASKRVVQYIDKKIKE